MDNFQEKLDKAPDMFDLVKLAVDEGTRIEKEFFNKKLDVLVSTLQEPKFRDLHFSAQQVIEFISALREK